MGARSSSRRGAPRARTEGADDPRVVRSRAAVVQAATALFMEKGYAGTTMEEIAARAGLTKRTVYNNYADKAALFTEIVSGMTAIAEEFARGLGTQLTTGITAAEVPAVLHDFGRRLALAILRPEIVAFRRLLIGESRTFPELARAYFDRAPGRVIAALASAFARMHRAGLLRTKDARGAAEQFAYLVVGPSLDRATLSGTIPPRARVIAGAREGVDTFLARWEVGLRTGAVKACSDQRGRKARMPSTP